MNSHFDIQANDWDSDYRIIRAKKITEKILQHVCFQTNDTVLEFGCGTGLISFNLIENIGQLTLVDTSNKMLSVTRDKFKEHIDSKKIIFENSIFSANLLNDSYNKIYSSMTMHHVNNINDTVKRFYSLLKSNGKLCIVDLMPVDSAFHKNEVGFDGYNGFDPKWFSSVCKEFGFDEIFRNNFFQGTKVENNNKINYNLFILVLEKNSTKQLLRSC